MKLLEVIAHARVRPGELAGVRARAAEIVRLTREQDRHTSRCDWFLSEDGTECEVHEMFPDEQGLVEHQMHIMPVRMLLFRDHAYDHRSTIFGEVSPQFIKLVQERMGAAPMIFSFLQGLEAPGRLAGEAIEDGVGGGAGQLEVVARLRVRPGQLEGFKRQVAEIMRLSREMDTRTLRYDWFLNEEGTECEVHEAYVIEEGLIEHNTHVMAARAILFEKYASDHRMTVYGEISQPLRDLFDKHAGGVSSYSFFQGLHAPAAV